MIDQVETTGTGASDELGERIKRLRDALGFSNRRFGIEVGEDRPVSGSSVARWIAGGGKPGGEHLEKMLELAAEADLLIYLTGVTRQQQYQALLDNERFQPDDGEVVYLEVKVDDVAGVFASILQKIKEADGNIIRLTTTGAPDEITHTTILVLFQTEAHLKLERLKLDIRNLDHVRAVHMESETKGRRTY